MDLYNKYGNCVIPKGTMLFRGSEDNNIKDVMFFGFRKNAILTYGTPQVWTAKKDIKLVFLINDIDIDSKCKSAIPELYSDFFNSTRLDNLEIKLCFETRTSFINTLKSQNIDGWFSSVEDKVELEVCLFNNIENKIKLSKTIKNEDLISNSLYNTQIFPSQNFYLNASETLREFGHKKYLDYINDWIQKDVENDTSMQGLKESYYNLRLKLEI